MIPCSRYAYCLSTGLLYIQLDRELGSGNGGSVERVVHKETGTIMARKLIHLGTGWINRIPPSWRLHNNHMPWTQFNFSGFNRVIQDTNEEVFKKILLELNILKDCNHKRVVAFYGSYQYQRSQIRICMEYMDGGSLDKVILASFEPFHSLFRSSRDSESSTSR